MSEKENFVDPNTDDLDAFTDLFVGRAKEQVSEPEGTAIPEEEEAADDSEVDALEQQNQDTHDGDDTSEDEDENEGEGEEKPVKPKSRFQERIDELTNARREAERRETALRQEFEALKAQLEGQNKPEPKLIQEAPAGPTPNDVNEDGTEKYPLGEFDPGYIRDLTRFTLEQERQAVRAQEEQEAANSKIEAERQALQESWSAKLGPAQERYPDFQEKGENLLATFEGIDQGYGEYLSGTLMSMEFGPDVLYYLANNVDEATKIVNSGPVMATIALGRLEAKFAAANEEKQNARPKVSKAPTPPPANKGSAPAVAEVPDDTDDLDAFAAKLFKTKRR